MVGFTPCLLVDFHLRSDIRTIFSCFSLFAQPSMSALRIPTIVPSCAQILEMHLFAPVAVDSLLTRTWPPAQVTSSHDHCC